MAELKYWIWLASRRGVGRKSATRLLDIFNTPEKLYFAREIEYKAAGLTPMEISSLSDKDLATANKAIEDCRRMNFGIISYEDAMYPERLRNIYDPPLVLYYKGGLPFIDDEAVVAIVGTRTCTDYGVKTAERIGYEFAVSGGVVVTGLARGIDSAAAHGALKAGGRVIGVVGNGLDIVYPPDNIDLYRAVEATGAIISEYAPGTPPRAANFPQRNRIISGLSLGVVVVEAPKASGSLITASLALEQGRDVFAVPGNIDAAACLGSNQLLKDGAGTLTSGWDLVGEYIGMFPDRLSLPSRKTQAPQEAVCEIAPAKASGKAAKRGDKVEKERKKEIDKDEILEYIDLVTEREALSEHEALILRAILNKVAHIDEIIETSGLDAPKALAALTMLEIKGVVSQTEGKKFRILIN